MGAKVAIIERNTLGGMNLSSAAIPTKTLQVSARIARQMRNSQEFGVNVKSLDVNFEKVMKKVQLTKYNLATKCSANLIKGMYNIDLYFGLAKFCSNDTIQVGETNIKFYKCTIATGSRPRIPTIKGLEKIPYFTVENIFTLLRQPRKMAIIGSGRDAAEFCSSFQRLGTEVVVITRKKSLLPREDIDVSHFLEKEILKDGGTFHFNTCVETANLNNKPGHNPDKDYDQIHLQLRTKRGKWENIFVDTVLVAGSKDPNV